MFNAPTDKTMTRITFILLISALLFIKCSDKKAIPISFDNQTPYQQTIKDNKIKSVYFTLDSGATSDHKIGDTLSIWQFDSTGSITFRRHFTFFGATTRNRYDEQGFLKHTQTTTDYHSEFYISTFIDTIRRIMYQKWFDQLTDFPMIVTYFNEKGKPDSSLSAYYHQGWPVRYKEYFTYQNNFLVKTIKITIDTLEARSKGKPKIDSTLYAYDNKQLKTIKSYKILMDGRTNITTDNFIKGLPSSRTTILDKYAIKENILTSKK